MTSIIGLLNIPKAILFPQKTSREAFKLQLHRILLHALTALGLTHEF